MATILRQTYAMATKAATTITTSSTICLKC